jgi:hypothetical protein
LVTGVRFTANRLSAHQMRVQPRPCGLEQGKASSCDEAFGNYDAAERRCGQDARVPTSNKRKIELAGVDAAVGGDVHVAKVGLDLEQHIVLVAAEGF